MKALPKGALTKEQQMQLDIEVRKHFIALLDKYNRDAFIMFLYVLRTMEKDPFGEKRLRMVARKLNSLRDEIKKRYAIDAVEWVCEKKLREEGLDVDSILNEGENHE